MAVPCNMTSEVCFDDTLRSSRERERDDLTARY
jgi:hypothetical protein